MHKERFGLDSTSFRACTLGQACASVAPDVKKPGIPLAGDTLSDVGSAAGSLVIAGRACRPQDH